MYVVRQIATILDYRNIQHSEKKWFDIIVPAILTIIFIIINGFLPYKLSFLSDNGVISLINGILHILSGFYIASLAAVATFNRTGMDDVMVGHPPKLKGKDITRRSFLTHLFGYLAFLSIFLYFAGGLAILASDNINLLLGLHPWSAFMIKYSCIILYLFLFFNMLCSTVLGLFFMITNNTTIK